MAECTEFKALKPLVILKVLPYFLLLTPSPQTKDTCHGLKIKRTS